MKLEDFDLLIKDGSIDTDGILKIRDTLNEYNTVIEGLQKDIEIKDNKIKDLQTVNSKLYLRITSPLSITDEESEPSVDDIIKNWGDI